ncbi:hypothetical protein M3196_00315 [Fictibacillus nanhaiensis]|uniref:hypothetical protein n=1 Tax=Fictibacillus nanhaiensis TaxID=742169 RepID=UPI00203C8F39|nr:hypothetical protein [Fictibacillus nanhaiensis]MCM3730111.1 hypothetical protein [Fictibacillus nanhaiensis]
MYGKRKKLIEVKLDGKTFVGKECTSCNKLKLLDEYSIHKKGLGGRQPKCKQCQLKYQRENKAVYKNASKKYYENNKKLISVRSKLKKSLSNPNYKPQNKWAKADIIKFIQDRHRSNESLTDSYMNINHGGLYGTAVYIFGSWRSAITEAGLNYEEIRGDALKISRLGLEFENILSEILDAVQLEVIRNKKFGKCIPDFVINNFQGHFIDAKLRFDSYSTLRTINKYKEEADVLTIVYLEGDRIKAYDNVRVLSVYEFMDRYLDNKEKKQEFIAKLKELEARIGSNIS